MRVLHAALLSTPSPGIQQQMVWEAEAAADLGLPWTTRIWTPYPEPSAAHLVPEEASSRSDAGGSSPWLWWNRKRAFYRWLVGESRRFDVILLRHTLFDPLEASALRRTAAPVALVHHNMEEAQLRLLPGVGGRARVMAESFFGRRALRGALALVGVTEEILEYERSRISHVVPGFVYANGTRVDPNEKLVDHRGNTPTLLFVSSEFQPWSGLDLLLDAIQADTKHDFKLELVGSIPAVEQGHPALKDPRVVVCGSLFGRDFDQRKAAAWLGLGSFAMERTGLTQGSTLRVRDYLRDGIPVYAGHRDGFPADFAFFEHGPVDLPAMLARAAAWRSVTRAEVVSAARPFIDKEALLSGLYLDLEALIGD